MLADIFNWFLTDAWGGVVAILTALSPFLAKMGITIHKTKNGGTNTTKLTRIDEDVAILKKDVKELKTDLKELKDHLFTPPKKRGK